jgi:hypothetical protein
MREVDKPLLPPPAGVQSNYVNQQSRAPFIVWSNAVALSLMLPCVVMRLYARSRILRSVWWDDCLYFPIHYLRQFYAGYSIRGLWRTALFVGPAAKVSSDMCILGAVRTRALALLWGVLTLSETDQLRRSLADNLDR